MTAPPAAVAWSSAAPGWDAGFDWYAQNLRPLSDWFCDRVATTGARVLDLACGTGLPAIAIAAKVGGTGRVIATDIAPGMLGALGRRARELGLPNIDLREMDALQIHFSDDSFDAVTCSCGLMLFPDPVTAAAEMRRVLVPNGRVAVAVWADPSENPFFTVAAAAVNAVFPPGDTDGKPPKGFSLAAPGELERVLRGGGLTDVAMERVAMKVRVTSVDEYWRLFTSFVPGLTESVAALPPSDLERARRVLADHAAPYEDGGCMSLDATAICALARKVTP